MIKKIIDKIKYILAPKCQECGAVLPDYEPVNLGKARCYRIFKCEKCGTVYLDLSERYDRL